jgi:hypothetical protein
MIHFYKPNARNAGAACSFYLNKSDESFFATILKQATWDDKKRRATFDKKSQIVVKLSKQEVADFIHAIESKASLSAYHQSRDNITKFNFTFSEKNDKSGFYFSVTQEPKDDSTQKASISVPLYTNEACLLHKHLEFLLGQFFELEDAKYEIKQQEYKAQQADQSHAPPQAVEGQAEEDPW